MDEDPFEMAGKLDKVSKLAGHDNSLWRRG